MILDFGCGSGRDKKFFLERGYCVQAIDESEEIAFNESIKQYPELTVEKQWITGDARPQRSEEKWLNNILRKSITS